jgi:hypothetical protein
MPAWSRWPVALVAALAFVASVPKAQDHSQHPAPEKLGRVHFATSCSPAVEADFDRAVALLHSFAFGTARKAFEGVLAKDQGCAMAYWGIALTHWGNPFGGLRSPSALASGSAVVEKAQAAGAQTARERGYIDAVAELFRDHATTDQRSRVLAYERAMEKVYRQHPDDREAAAFYALAVNQTALPTDKTYAQQLKAAAILEPLFAAQPEHPGLAHYIIHAYDHPPLAPKALDAARRYAKIAPSVPHALHMPSHTFTRVGHWQESIETNIASAESARRDGSPGEALHAMDYQVYAYLQTGQDRAARTLVEQAAGMSATGGGAVPGPAAGYAAFAIPARYAMERGAWDEAAALEARPSRVVYAEAVTYFARAIGAARSGRPEPARADLDRLRALQAKLAEMNDEYWAEQLRIQHQAASAWTQYAEGRKTEALDLMRQAADAEDASDKSAISPGPLAPARELLGEMLLAMERPPEALAAFEAVMKKEPNRFRATYLAAKAAEAAGDRAKARTYFTELVAICQAGDAPGRPELEEARARSR